MCRFYDKNNSTTIMLGLTITVAVKCKMAQGSGSVTGHMISLVLCPYANDLWLQQQKKKLKHFIYI